uniref:Ribonuclease VapC n=1 Tax=Chlorobium chlorochromatii (strain CaD3) TaxID=340177 RepID=Q3ASS2_CHLCH
MSGLKYILDTNIIIGLLKANPTAIALAESVRLDLGECAISQITRMELLGCKGISEAEESSIHQFLACCVVLMIDETVECEAIRFRKHSSLKLPDAIIAATAQVHNLNLLSLDERLVSQYERAVKDNR